MKKILVGPLTNAIYYGKAKDVGGGIFEMASNKVEITDDCIKAVYQWFLNHCKDEESKFYQIKFANNAWLTMDCSDKTAEDKIKELEAELTQLKAEKSGEWVDIGASKYDDTDKCYKCSVCGKEINGYDIGYYFKFCHGCGAKMKEDS